MTLTAVTRRFLLARTQLASNRAAFTLTQITVWDLSGSAGVVLHLSRTTTGDLGDQTASRSLLASRKLLKVTVTDSESIQRARLLRM